MLRWFGHVERSSGAVRTACDTQIEGRRGGGREAEASVEETDIERSSRQLTLKKGAPGVSDQV